MPDRSHTLRIALVAPPFIAVPPRCYGGTELFLAHLAEALACRGHDIILYSNGECAASGRIEHRWLYATGEWPIRDPLRAALKELRHYAWAVRDIAAARLDAVHLNAASALALTPFIDAATVYTVHHEGSDTLAEFYAQFPQVRFVTISRSQRLPDLPYVTTIHHGLDASRYMCPRDERSYLCFLGRLAPLKGTHVAIEVARRSGIPLKIAGEIQPAFAQYWETEIRPHVDGRFIEYVGEADAAVKNELLGGARALLFPIQWEEPFGLVVLEALACGAPVLAFGRGSIPEIVRDGVCGHICADVDEMATRAREMNIPPERCRRYVEERFSSAAMARAYEDVYRAAAAERLAGAA